LDYWAPKLNRNKERDAANIKLLRNMGWRVFVVWECQTSEERKLRTKLTAFLKE
jgi:DNA mismatch endonuclease (patch repair protein)